MFTGSLARGRRTAPIVVQPTLPAPQGNHAIAVPGDNPSISSFAEPWSISLNESFTPHASAPVLVWCDEIGRASRDLHVTGYQFSDDTQLHVYGQSSSGATAILTCTRKYRNSGNVGIWQLPAQIPSRAFCLLWPYDPTYGYGYPIPVNAPWAKTCNGELTGGPSGPVGGTVYSCGVNLCDDNSTGDARIYLYPTGGGSGTWVTPTSARDCELVWTIPNIATGTYELWIHNKRGGRYGWYKYRSNFTIGTLSTLGYDFTSSPAISVNLSTYTAIHGGGPGSGVSMVTAWNAAVAALSSKGGIIVLEAGTYVTNGELFTLAGGGLNIKVVGQGKGVTIIEPMSGYSHNSSYGLLRNGSDVEGVTFNFASGIGTGLGSLLKVRRLVNCAVDTKGYGTTVCAEFQTAVGCDFAGGANTGTMTGTNSSWDTSNNLALNCNFRLANYAHMCISNFFGARNHLVTNCHAEDYGSGAGNRGYGRLFGSGGVVRGLSVIDCTTNGLTVDPSDTNRGEQILVDDSSGTSRAFDPSGGTTTTIRVLGSALVAMPTIRAGSNLASTNATSGTPTITGTGIPTSQTGTGWYVRITGGTNAIVGTYPVTNVSGSIRLTGAIGTTASISGITWELAHDPARASGSDLASSDATGSTPTITTAASISTGDFLYITGGTNALTGLYRVTITGGIKKLDRACGSAASISSVTFKTFDTYSQTVSQTTLNQQVAVVGGPGLGQYAHINSSALDSNTQEIVYTLDRTWKVPVTSASRCYLGNGVIDVTISKNVFDGDGTNTGASCAFQAFTAAYGIHFWDNEVSGLNQGVSLFAAANDRWGGKINSPQMRVYVADSSFDSCRMVTRIWQTGSLEYKQEINAIFSLRDITGASVLGGGPSTSRHYFWFETYGGAMSTLFQNFTISGSANEGIGYFYDPPIGNLLLHDCSISTTDNVGSVAIEGSLTITADPSPASSQFTGFAS